MADVESKPKGLKKVGNHFAKSWSELKKVSWPSFSTVLKNTAVVLVVTLFFLLILLAADSLFGWLLSLVKGA